MGSNPDTLSPQDRSLLDRFFALHGDLAALALESGRSLLDLHLWADSPEIAPLIHLHRRNTAAARREKALAALESVLQTSDDPIERRRVACALLRHQSPRRHLTELDLPLPSASFYPPHEPPFEPTPEPTPPAASDAPAFHPPAPRPFLGSLLNIFREPAPPRQSLRRTPGELLTAAGIATRDDSG